MIRVDITLDRKGLGIEEARLGLVEIVNDLTGTATRGNYNVRVYDRNGKRVVRTARVENWPREGRTATALIAACFAAAYPEAADAAR